MASTGVLRVRLSHAVGLKSADSNGYSDPYCKLTLGKTTFKSPIIKKTLNPRWDKDFVFSGTLHDLVSMPGGLKIHMWDWDRLSSDDNLGDGSIDLRALMQERVQMQRAMAAETLNRPVEMARR